MSLTAVPSRRARLLSRQVRELGSLLGGIPLAIGAFVVGVAGLTVSAATLVVWVGVPILAATLDAAGWFASAERDACERATGRPLPAHAYRPVERRFDRVSDPQLWRDLVHAVLAFPVRIAAAAIGLSWTAGSVALSLFVLWEPALPRGDVSGLYDLITGDYSRSGEIVLNTALGLLALFASPFVVHAMATMRSAFARALLTNAPEVLRRQADAAEASRRAGTRAEQHNLSRIERDIHDGPQQRLVRLTMDLETARRRLEDDPEAARGLLTEAAEQSREALDELRSLSRGIAPPVLTERGLVAAVAAAAARCPVDTVLDTSLPVGRRYAEESEAAAYFVVTEALTNVAKHSGAGTASVDITDTGSVLQVSIGDDGHGGAHIGKGHGLAGLAERVSALGGALDISSPAGGPTRIVATIPLDREDSR